MNSWAEQQAIVQELIDTLDATLVEGTSYGTGPAHPRPSTRRVANHVGGDGAAVPSTSVSGLERARQLAAQAISLQPDPIPEQPELFE